MSPLVKDSEYRGAHASHVHPNYKLGKHRTVLTSALPLLNWLIDDQSVSSISLGKLTHAGGKRFSPRAECITNGLEVTVLLVEKGAAQAMRVFARSPDAAAVVAERIKAKWGADVVGTPRLKAIS